MVPVDKGFPMPTARNNGRARGKQRNEKFPWFEMVVGDSFLMKQTNRNSITRQATDASYRTGFKFTCRRQPNNCYRIWRTA